MAQPEPSPDLNDFSLMLIAMLDRFTSLVRNDTFRTGSCSPIFISEFHLDLLAIVPENTIPQYFCESKLEDCMSHNLQEAH